MLNELGLFYVAFLTVPLCIQWDQFIIVQVTLTTPSHHVPSSFMLDFKRLRLKLFNIVTLLPSRSFMEITLTDPKNIDYCQINICQSQPSNR